MKQKKLYLILFLIPFFFSCDKADDFKVAEPVTYYLCDEAELSLLPGPGGGWNYITNYIYPTPPTNSCSWSVYLNKNIVKGEYGCNLIFWAASECQVRMEFILNDDGQESVLLSKDLTITYISESMAIQYNHDAETNPISGTNPKKGKNIYLVLRITHISGTDPVEILYDGATGTIGCTSITVFHDK
jgi:hypothetical protein